MYLIEFCGAPGTGKTTVCRFLEKELKAEGLKVKNLEMPQYSYGKIKKRLVKLAFFFDKDCRRIMWAAHKYLTKADKADKKRWVGKILLAVYSAKETERNGFDVATFEEGCIQYITSAVHGVPISEESLEFAKVVVEAIYRNREEILINCKLELMENVSRLKNRNRSGDRFSCGTEEEIEARLKLKIENINKCSELLDKNKVFSVDLGNFPTAIESINRIVFVRLGINK